MFFKISRDSGKPVFEQIKSKIKDSIVRGKLSVGDTLPSVRNLAKILGVNVNTVARAYRELEMEGVVEGKKGYGYVVKGKPSREKWLEEKRKEFERSVRDLMESGVDMETIERWLEDMRGDEGARG